MNDVFKLPKQNVLEQYIHEKKLFSDSPRRRKQYFSHIYIEEENFQQAFRTHIFYFLFREHPTPYDVLEYFFVSAIALYFYSEYRAPISSILSIY